MGRGVGAGVAAGSVVAVLGLGLLSLGMPLPSPAPGAAANAPVAPGGATSEPPVASAPAGGTATLDVPPGSEFARGSADTAPAAPAVVAETPERASVPVPPATQGEPPVALPGTEPPTRPEAAVEAPVAPEAPQTATAALETAPRAETPMPVPPPGEAVAPDLPAAESAPAPAPERATAEAPMPAATEAAPAAPAETPAPAPEAGSVAPEEAAPAAAERAPEAPAAAPVPATPEPAPPAAEQEITLMPDGAVVPPKPDLPRVFAVGEGGNGFAGAEGTTVNRLPQIGERPQAKALPRLAPPAATPAETAKPGFQRPPGAEPAPEAALPRVITPDPGPSEAAAPVAPGAVPLPEDAALRRYAAAFTEVPGIPLFSVVLIDVGTAAGGLDPATIRSLGPAVTVAIDPERPGAAAAMADYRAAGMEVAILADPLPPGATPQDVEVALDAWQRALPEAVALVEPERPVMQVSSRLVNQAVKVLQAGGMAYVTQAIGIEGAAQIARNAGLPQASVWRVLDSRRDKAPVIERTLSRAAFEASRKGGVVVMLSAWPESVAGLSQWLAEAQGKVTPAPLSAMALRSAGN